MGGPRVARAPAPSLDVAVVDRGGGGPRAGPRPSARPVAQPEAPEVRVGPEAVRGGGPDTIELADRLPAEPEPVVQPVLGARELDDVDRAHRRGVERDAIAPGLIARRHD